MKTLFQKLPAIAGLGLTYSTIFSQQVLMQQPDNDKNLNNNKIKDQESLNNENNYQEQKFQTLVGQIDAYKVLHLYDEHLQSSNNIFQKQLEEVIQSSQKQGCKAIWLKLAKNQLYLSQEAINQGFEIHHAEKNYLMLNKWLDPKKHNNLPEYCTHMIGCGGVVINEQNQVLLVKEKNGYRKGTWNIPGGRVDTGESIVQGTIREVKEETGLTCTYSDVVMFREVQNTLFGKPDIYFAFLLKTQNYNVKIQKEELTDFKWVDIRNLQNIVNNKVPEIKVIVPTQKAILRQLYEFNQQGKIFYKDKIFNATFKNYFNRPYNVFTPNL